MANEGNRWGGSEPLWSLAAEKLARAGNKVHVSVKDWGSPLPQIERLRAAGCTIFPRKPFGPLPYRIAQRFFPLPTYKFLHLRSISKASDLIVISQSENTDGLEWMEAARAAGRKYAVIAQSAVVYWWPPDPIAERLATAYDNAAAAYFVSQAILDLTALQVGNSSRNAKVVRQPFNVPYDARPPWPAANGDQLRLAFVGRLDIVSKAQDILLQVLALPHWRQRNLQLSLVGDGPYQRVLRRITKDLQLTNVHFLGASDDIEDVWKRHHVLVLPSRFEGMPLVVIEAMLCARPCIVTDVGGNTELVRDGVNGFLAKAPTVEFLNEAMERAWQSRDCLQEMGQRAALDVRTWVSPDPAEDFARELMRLANARNA